MRVYVNTYAANDDVLLGYKGAAGGIDAAAFYCPYVPSMSSGVVVDPLLLSPVSFMTRYGYVELTNTASSLGNAADYVSKIAVSNLAFV